MLRPAIQVRQFQFSSIENALTFQCLFFLFVCFKTEQKPQSAPSDMEEAVEEEKMEEDVAEEIEQEPPGGETEGPFPETHPQTSSASVKTAPTTPTFPFK